MAGDRRDDRPLFQAKNTNNENPMSLNYMRYMRILLISVGSWPGAIVKNKPRRIPFYSIYLIIEAAALIWGEVQFIHKRFHILSFYTLGNMYITLSLAFLIFYRAALSCIKRYGTIIREFIMKFHLIHFKDKNKDWLEMYEKVNQASYYFTVFIMVLSGSGVISFNITPLYRNYQLGVFSDQQQNVSMEFAVYYQYPGFKQEDFFLACTLANVAFSYTTACIICSMDLFLCLMIFQIIGHIWMLLHTLKQFPRPQTRGCTLSSNGTTFMAVNYEKFDDEENEVIRNTINQCVGHHRFIVSFTDDISSFFGPMLAFNYLYQMFSFSLLLVECMQGKAALMRYGPLTMMTLAQLTQLSVTFEIVGTESEKLINEVYCLPWESMNLSNQKAVLFFLKRVQTPIRVTAMGMTAVGVKTMGKILRTSFSYCAFLSSLNA